MGSMKSKCIFSTLNWRLPEGQVCQLMDDTPPVVFLYDSEAKDFSVKAIKLAKQKPRVCVMCGEGDVPEGHVRYEEFIRGKSTVSPEREKDVRWVTPSLMLYTSGTTGLPKGFVLNHAMILFDNMMNVGLEKLDGQSVNLVTNPLFHRGGNTTGPIPCLHAGGKVMLMQHFSEDEALNYIERYKVTHMVSAPTVYERMAHLQEEKPRDVSSLRAGSITSMGAPLEREACLRMMRVLTPNVMNGYGTADAHWVTMLKPYELPEKAGTIGLAITEDMIRLVKMYEDRRGDPENPDDLCPIDGETEGEIALRTMHCPYGYINRPEDTEKVFPYRGWQLPGDVAVWDKDGFITISGRVDDMIITGAENVHPAIVEEALKEHPAVVEAIVTGAPSKE
jgi:acyl-CoA synthetase (AMP-forming)/AMP-acid ligase II